MCVTVYVYCNYAFALAYNDIYNIHILIYPHIVFYTSVVFVGTNLVLYHHAGHPLSTDDHYQFPHARRKCMIFSVHRQYL